MYQEKNSQHYVPVELDVGYLATFRRLRRLFLSRGVPREEAADLAQEAIARALLHLQRNGHHDRYEGVDPLLNTIATNLLIDRARASGPRLVSIETAEEIDDATQDPSEEVARLHEHRAVRSAIGGLSPRHRNALLLSLDGKSPAEIAEHMGIQRNAADALLHRARRRLADRLRVTTDAALGLVAFVGFKVRWTARRAADALRSIESVATAPLAYNAAVLALATILVAPSIGGAQTRDLIDRDQASVAATAMGTSDDAVGSAIVRAPRDSGAITADRPSRSVGTKVHAPGTTCEAGCEAGVKHRKSENPGLTGWLLGETGDVACETVPASCDVQVKP